MLARLRSFITACRASLPVRLPTDDGHTSELDRLEARLRDEKRKTETLARITYTKWKLRQSQEKEYTLRYGVAVPATTAQREQDEFFAALERRMEEEQCRYVEETKALEYKDDEADRIERQRQATERVVRVLEEDLG